MNNDTQYKISVMQAYADGKQIQFKSKLTGEWTDTTSEPRWMWDEYLYRIKPESRYRPYQNTDEMIADFKERFNVNCPKYEMPLIWIVDQDSKETCLIIGFKKDCVGINDDYYYLNAVRDMFEYLDGSPIGKKEK